MDTLKEIDMDEMSAADHIAGIKFYSFLKFRRFIVQEIKDTMKQQMDDYKTEIQKEIRSMFKKEKATFIQELIGTVINYDEK